MLKKFMAFLAALYMVTAFAAVDVNKATIAELDSVKGIGPSISAKIVDERKKGEFKDWPDFVRRVNGIGEVTAKKFSDQGMTVGGASFTGMPAGAPAKDGKKDAKKAEGKPAAAAPAPAPAASPATAAAPVDAKAEAKMKADETKAQKAAEKKAKADEKKKQADDAKAAKAAAAAPAPKGAASAAKK